MYDVFLSVLWWLWPEWFFSVLSFCFWVSQFFKVIFYSRIIYFCASETCFHYIFNGWWTSTLFLAIVNRAAIWWVFWVLSRSAYRLISRVLRQLYNDFPSGYSSLYIPISINCVSLYLWYTFILGFLTWLRWSLKALIISLLVKCVEHKEQIFFCYMYSFYFVPFRCYFYDLKQFLNLNIFLSYSFCLPRPSGFFPSNYVDGILHSHITLNIPPQTKHSAKTKPSKWRKQNKTCPRQTNK